MPLLKIIYFVRFSKCLIITGISKTRVENEGKHTGGKRTVVTTDDLMLRPQCRFFFFFFLIIRMQITFIL